MYVFIKVGPDFILEEEHSLQNACILTFGACASCTGSMLGLGKERSYRRQPQWEG